MGMAAAKEKKIESHLAIALKEIGTIQRHKERR